MDADEPAVARWELGRLDTAVGRSGDNAQRASRPLDALMMESVDVLVGAKDQSEAAIRFDSNGMTKPRVLRPGVASCNVMRERPSERNVE